MQIETGYPVLTFESLKINNCNEIFDYYSGFFIDLF